MMEGSLPTNLVISLLGGKGVGEGCGWTSTVIDRHGCTQNEGVTPTITSRIPRVHRRRFVCVEASTLILFVLSSHLSHEETPVRVL